MHTTRPDIWIAELMQLPGSRNGKIAGTEIEPAVVGHENHIPGFDKMYFNALIPVGVEAPILRPGPIPKADAVQARQGVVWNRYSRIMPLAKSR